MRWFLVAAGRPGGVNDCEEAMRQVVKLVLLEIGALAWKVDGSTGKKRCR